MSVFPFRSACTLGRSVPGSANGWESKQPFPLPNGSLSCTSERHAQGFAHLPITAQQLRHLRSDYADKDEETGPIDWDAFAIDYATSVLLNADDCVENCGLPSDFTSSQYDSSQDDGGIILILSRGGYTSHLGRFSIDDKRGLDAVCVWENDMNLLKNLFNISVELYCEYYEIEEAWIVELRR